MNINFYTARNTERNENQIILPNMNFDFHTAALQGGMEDQIILPQYSKKL